MKTIRLLLLLLWWAQRCKANLAYSTRRRIQSLPIAAATIPKPNRKSPSTTSFNGSKPAKAINSASSVSAPLTVPQRLLAGGISRCLAQMMLYPIDALRTLAQTRDGRTLADLGLATLVRGCVTTSAFALFIGSIQFAIFGMCRDTVGPVVASALGAAGSCVVCVPQEVLKQRLVTGVYSSFGEAVRSISSTEGIRGFYSAWKPTVARNVPFVMTTFTTMDILKRRRLRQRQQQKAVNEKTPSDDNDEELTLLENMVIGMSSAMVAGLLTNPVDVVKTRLMTQAASTAVPYSNVWDCVTTIVQTEGPATFFSGLKQRSAYMCLLWGITFAVNGKLQTRMEHQKTREASRK